MGRSVAWHARACRSGECRCGVLQPRMLLLASGCRARSRSLLRMVPASRTSRARRAAARARLIRGAGRARAGRAMELGRECLEIWGYKRVDELVWVKTNQLQRLIRTGRTGHWLNHSKEHCLVGVKGAPAVNRNVDCDVLVAEARARPAGRVSPKKRSQIDATACDSLAAV